LNLRGIRRVSRGVVRPIGRVPIARSLGAIRRLSAIGGWSTISTTIVAAIGRSIVTELHM
jgi:hypothetical protein